MPPDVKAARVAVVGQHLDDAALRHLALAAAGHHARQLLLQRAQPERFYTEALCLDLSHAPLRHAVTMPEMQAALAVLAEPGAGRFIRRRAS